MIPVHFDRHHCTSNSIISKADAQLIPSSNQILNTQSHHQNGSNQHQRIKFIDRRLTKDRRKKQIPVSVDRRQSDRRNSAKSKTKALKSIEHIHSISSDRQGYNPSTHYLMDERV